MSVMNGSAFWAVAIHDQQGSFLAFDLKDVLDALGEEVRDYTWLIAELDCTGEAVQDLVDQVDDARLRGPGAVPVPGPQLLKLAGMIDQTLEAQLYAVAQTTVEGEDFREIIRAPLRADSPVRLMVSCIRGAAFEIITKRYRHVELLRSRFKDVREQDPAPYLVLAESKQR
jgi:hypothetical protein